MAQEDPLWIQGVSYTGREDRILLGKSWSEGVIEGCGVIQIGPAMMVRVQAGSGIIVGDDESRQGSYLVVCTSNEDLAISAAPASNSRIDLVYWRVNDPNAGGPAGNNSSFGIVIGTPAASPSVPALPTSAIPLAHVLVAAGTVSILDSMITSARVKADPYGMTPIGVPLPWAAPEANIHTDWVLCRGQAISRSTYWPLFNVIGTLFGAGNGTTTFNVPDLRGRAIFGLDNMGGSDAGRLAAANTLGLGGGQETVTLTTAEMPVHTHLQNSHNHTQNSHTHVQDSHNHTQDSHTHSQNSHNHTQQPHLHLPFAGIDSFAGSEAAAGAFSYGAVAGTSALYSFASTEYETALNNATTATNIATTATNQATTATNQATTATNIATTATNQNAGSGDAHDNMPPYMLMNWMMRAR